MFCPSCGKELPHGSTFCLHCGKPTADTAQAPQKNAGGTTLRVIGIALLVLVLAPMLWIKFNSPTTSSQLPYKPPVAPQPVFVPMSTNLFTGQTVVRAGGYVTNSFTVEPGMQNFRVVGKFNASGGTGNDIQVVLADEDEFQNWINGHEAKVFYSTEKITTGKLDVGALSPGRYVLALSNRFSVFTDKQVFAEIDARWTAQR
jgi:hypothetical protein